MKDRLRQLESLAGRRDGKPETLLYLTICGKLFIWKKVNIWSVFS